MPKTDFVQNNFTGGEISPNALGRFDLAKYANSAKIIENFLLKQLGGAEFRPGTRFVKEVKDSADRTRLLKFLYSTEQNYVIEAGDQYFRFYTDGGALLSSGTHVEIATVFELDNLTLIKYAQNADTMYVASGVYPVQKLQRTSATTFTISEVTMKRGPLLDTNITSTTITPSAATGSGITLTASSSIFESGHVGSLWRVNGGVVKITGYSSGTSVTGDVQAEPDGTAGNLGGTSAYTDWSEGAWSAVRGYPKVVTFHEGRLYFAATTYQPSGVWGSVPFAYENFYAGADDDDAISIELNADTVVAIRWLSSSSKSLQAGTTGGIFSISSGGQQALTPSNISASRENIFGTADIQARRMFNNVYYVQNDLRRFLECGYFFDIDQNDAIDTTLLADHILELSPSGTVFYRGDVSAGGAYDLDSQQSPNNRMWIVRSDGQLVVLTRNVRQEVNGWCRILSGETISCDGKSGAGWFESIVIIPQEEGYDQVWVICNRIINGSAKRFIEFFTDEFFKFPWEPVRLDSSLTYNDPATITDIDLTVHPVRVTAAGHGFLDGDQIRLDTIVGTHQLNERKFIIGNVTTNTFDLFQEVLDES